MIETSHQATKLAKAEGSTSDVGLVNTGRLTFGVGGGARSRRRTEFNLSKGIKYVHASPTTGSVAAEIVGGAYYLVLQAALGVVSEAVADEGACTALQGSHGWPTKVWEDISDYGLEAPKLHRGCTYVSRASRAIRCEDSWKSTGDVGDHGDAT